MRKLTQPRAIEDRPLARAIGARLRAERQRQHLTQAALAGERYTKAYISALENGLAKPSMAALNYLAGRLSIPVTRLLVEEQTAWIRLEVDLRLASGDWPGALDGYTALLQAGGGDRAELLRGIAEASARLERGEAAVRAAAEAATLFEAHGRPIDAAWARYWESFGLYLLEHGDEARRLLAHILDDVAAGTLVEPDLNIRALVAMAVTESRDGEPERALGYLEQARALVEGLDDRRRAAFLYTLATSYRDVGDLEAAVSAGARSLAYFRSADAELEAAALEGELALVYLALGNSERAREHAAASRATFERLGTDRNLAHLTDTEAQIELASGAPGRAIELAEAAMQLARASHTRKAELSGLLTLARGRRAMGDVAGAVAPLEEAVSIAREHGRRGQLQSVLGELAEVVAEQGDLKRAFQLSQEALTAGRAKPSTGSGPRQDAAAAIPTSAEAQPRS
jgi:transcriptional regulator with XRE-family HTH domain